MNYSTLYDLDIAFVQLSLLCNNDVKKISGSDQRQSKIAKYSSSFQFVLIAIIYSIMFLLQSTLCFEKGIV